MLPLALDVANIDAVQGAVAATHQHSDRLDVVLKNVGYALAGAIEEVSENDLRAEIDTNVFGMLRAIQAAPSWSAPW